MKFLYFHSMLLTICFLFSLELVIVLKANAKKHVEDLVKDRDCWKMNCIKLWKGVAPVLDVISPELPEDQPRALRLTPVEKAQQTWG